MPQTDQPMHVFVVDDDREMRQSLRQYLTKSGYLAETFSTAQEALTAIQTGRPDVLVSDVRMPGMSGLDLLGKVKEINSVLPMLLITAHGDVPMAVEAMRSGAFDFVEKPFQPARLLDTIRRAAEFGRLRSENRNLRDRLRRLSGLNQRLIGDCPEMCRLREDVEDAAAIDASVLILGATGTGKELVARALHDLSHRCGGPFIPVNCAAIPGELFESEMFGHLAGAFTGATKSSPGHFVSASGGTLFLDELGDCPTSQQPKLLRALEAREVIPVGCSKPKPIDIRIVSATNDDLDEHIKDGTFREDLYFRLNTLVLRIPPLHARGDDVVILFNYYLDSFARIYEVEAPLVTGDDIATLIAHEWPGNVRELCQVAERRILSSRRGRGTVAQALQNAPLENNTLLTLKQKVEQCERLLIDRALATHAGQIEFVMNELGIARRTLNEKMLRYGLQRQDYS